MNNNKLVEKIKFHKNNLMSYLFDNENLKNNFIKNQKIKLPNSFEKLLYYPNENFLRGFLKGKKKFNQLYNCIFKIIKQDFKDNFNQTYRCVHPSFFLIFYENFIKDGFEYNYTATNTVKISHNNIYLRPQYYQCFKIYFDLIDDKDLKFILNDKIKILYTDLIIEDRIMPEKLYSGRYVDMSYILNDNNKIFIEINENSHNKHEDYLRMRQIYSHSLNKIVQFYIEKNLISIKKDLYTEFSKKFYNIDKTIGTNFYMIKVKGFKPFISEYFTKMRLKLLNGGCSLNDFINMLTDMNFKDCKKFIRDKIKKNIICSEHFVGEVDIDNLKSKMKSKKWSKNTLGKSVKLNSSGVTKILNIVRDKDWDQSNDISNAYAKFFDCFYEMIEDFLGNMNNELKLIYDEHKTVKNFIHSEKRIYQVGIEFLRIASKKCSKLNHHKIIPSLIEDEKFSIDYKDIEKKISDRKIYNNFVKKTESQRVLNGYRWISQNEIDTILDDFNNLESNDLDSDDESM